MKIIKIKNKNNMLLNNIFEQIKFEENKKRVIKKDIDIKFVHISKTGGTTIEDIGFENNYLWGRFDHEYLNKFKRVKYQDCSVWHVPLQYFEKNPYENKILFTIVRNPYERCISEFYCPCTGCSYQVNNKKEFNKWIQEKIKLEIDNHFLPYYEYLNYNDKEIINYIIHFENLKEEFDKLFDNIKLNIHSNKHRFTKIFSIKDLEDETIRMINKKYKKDFELFNYEMIIR